MLQERNTLMEICETPGLLDLLPGILTRHLDTQQHLDAAVQEFRAAARAAAAAAAGDTVSATSGSDGSDDSSINSSSGDKSQASDSQVFGHNHQDGAEAKATEAIGEDANGQQVVDSDGGVRSAAEHEALAKAQAHVAWLLAALASDIRTRYVGLVHTIISDPRLMPHAIKQHINLYDYFSPCLRNPWVPKANHVCCTQHAAAQLSCLPLLMKVALLCVKSCSSEPASVIWHVRSCVLQGGDGAAVARCSPPGGDAGGINP
jgi:hypothetical protein